MKLVEELANSIGLGTGVSHNTILSLNAGTRDHVLPL
jgi:hypothetical protein